MKLCQCVSCRAKQEKEQGLIENFKNGTPVIALASKYDLSEHEVEHIIRQALLEATKEAPDGK